MSTASKKRKRSRLGKCDICRTTDANYTCPRCETVSCSLNCVKKHKIDLDCDGVRVQTKYVPADTMSENNVLSDYRLLEDVRRCIEEAELRRDSLEKLQESVASADTTSSSCSNSEPDSIDEVENCVSPIEKNNEDNHLNIRKTELLEAVTHGSSRKAAAMETLTKVAFFRGINLSSLPARFERHWENTSFFMSNENCIYWHVRISFINGNFHTLTLNECPETMKLEDVIKECLGKSEVHSKSQPVDDPLEVYRAVDFSKISVLMIADKLPKNQRKFYVLDMSKTLCENFMGKCIVEFPQLYIALEDCYTVSTVHENVPCNFFGEDFDSDIEEEPQNEFERIWKKSTKKKLKTSGKRKSMRNNDNDDSERESGELTDSSCSSSSSDNFFSDSDSNDDSSEDELFKESEFRSVYKDLLTTFEADVNHLKRKI